MGDVAQRDKWRSSALVSSTLHLLGNFHTRCLLAVSHEVPEEPVVSPASGRVFERRLITKWVQDNGTDPVNEEPLAIENLITING